MTSFESNQWGVCWLEISNLISDKDRMLHWFCYCIHGNHDHCIIFCGTCNINMTCQMWNISTYVYTIQGCDYLLYGNGRNIHIFISCLNHLTEQENENWPCCQLCLQNMQRLDLSRCAPWLNVTIFLDTRFDLSGMLKWTRFWGKIFFIQIIISKTYWNITSW